MSDTSLLLGPSLKALGKSDWLEAASDIMAETGDFLSLGKRHWATQLKGDTTLLVTFETLQSVQHISPTAHPLGWSLANRNGWSQLSLISDGDTWFRDKAVYGLFDDLVDACFFDDFDHVLFYGAGSCGYAAAAYSVAAPGARVLALQPQATLDPRQAGWDPRFTEFRKLSFTDRYGYAPDMIEACARAHIVFDPRETFDSMHAALFARPNVSKLELPNMGSALLVDLWQMGLLDDLIEAAVRGRLTGTRFARLVRARRDHLPYLRRLLAKLDQDDRAGLADMLCANVSGRMRAPRFARRLKSDAQDDS